MGIAGTENGWWRDVLENGQASLFASHFDIDWTPPKVSLAGRVLLPVLADQYGEALENGELRIAVAGGALEIQYRDQRFPMAPDSLLPLLEEAANNLARPAGDVAAQELASIVTALRHLPGRGETELERRKERAREGEVQKRRLAALCGADPEVDSVLQEVVARTNGSPGEPRSFDRLDALLSAQPYRLCSWRVAAEQINYRRFFDVNALAALRMEDEPVFAAAHGLVLELIGNGTIQGLRLDHVDGLYDLSRESAPRHRSRPARERGA
jgi:(1->4)-alpha-D-glucan 1-alpha-D-glucosylmutase